MTQASLNWADLAIIGIITLSAIIGIVRGLVREVISLLTWILAFWVAFSFSSNLAPVFSTHIDSASLRYGLAFFCLFVLFLMLGGFVNFLIAKVIKTVGLKSTDRLLGVFFGAIRGVFLVGLLLLLGTGGNFTQATWWRGSSLIPEFEPVTHWLEGLMPDSMETYFVPHHDKGVKATVEDHD